MEKNHLKYFVEEGCALSTKKGILGPHREVMPKYVGEDNSATKEILDKHVKDGKLYKAAKPTFDVAEARKNKEADTLRANAAKDANLKEANGKIKVLEANEENLKTQLADAKKELENAVDPEALKAANDAHEVTTEALAEAKGNLDASEELLGETQVKLSDADKAHDATKKELKELKASIKAK